MEVLDGEDFSVVLDITYTYIGEQLYEMNMYYSGEKVATVQRSKELKEGSWYEIVFHKTTLPLAVVTDIVDAYSLYFNLLIRKLLKNT